jgi:hypothetical protein
MKNHKWDTSTWIKIPKIEPRQFVCYDPLNDRIIICNEGAMFDDLLFLDSFLPYGKKKFYFIECVVLGEL